jgi:hypothetical protein
VIVVRRILDYDNDNDNDNDAVVFSIVCWFVGDLWATNGRDSVRGRQAR